MKQFKVTAIAILTLSSAYVGYSVYNDMDATKSNDFFLENVEAFALGDEESGESTEYINCFCSTVSDQVCGSGNSGSKCAGGKGVHCSEYNDNCAS